MSRSDKMAATSKYSRRIFFVQSNKLVKNQNYD